LLKLRKKWDVSMYFFFVSEMVQFQIVVCCSYCCVHIIYKKEVLSNNCRMRWQKLLCQIGLAYQKMLTNKVFIYLLYFILMCKLARCHWHLITCLQYIWLLISSILRVWIFLDGTNAFILQNSFANIGKYPPRW
jgi:hypothetical protein